jgi:hypothetical protein
MGSLAPLFLNLKSLTMNHNYLIAEFIGMTSCSDGWYDYANDQVFIELEFHKSWDWLIPVVSKILTKHVANKNVDNKDLQHLIDVLPYGKIEDVYNAVVSFIKNNTDTERIMKIKIADMDSDSD